MVKYINTIKIMNTKQHLIVSLVSFSILAFEFIVFTDILMEPYMVGLCLFLGCTGGYHLGSAFIKNKYEKKND